MKKHNLLSHLIIFVFLFSGNATAAQGDVDTNYGVGGIVHTPSGANVIAASATSNNGIIVAGIGHHPSDFRITQLLSDGTEDASFGSSGHVEINLPSVLGISNFNLTDMARTNNQETIITGYNLGSIGGDGVLAKLDANGNLDSTFANGVGALTLRSFAPFTGQGHIIPYALAVDANNHILVATRCLYGTLVARFTPSGTLDNSFANNGVLAVSYPLGGQFPHMPVSLEIDPLGIITYGYWVLTGSSTALTTKVVTQLDPNGNLVTNFGNSGHIIVPAANGEELVSVKRDVNNRTLLLTKNCVLSRYTTNGVLDTSFGNNGAANVVVPNGNSSLCLGLTLRPTSAPIVTGSIQQNNNHQLLDARFDNSGQPVANFANGGVAIVGQPPFAGIVNAYGAAFSVLQSNGHIQVATTERPYLNNFAVTAIEDTALNVSPRPARIGRRMSVALNTWTYSIPFTVSDLTSGAKVMATIEQGEYSINNEPYTTSPGFVQNGDLITVRHRSASCFNCSKRSTLELGGYYDTKNGGQRLGGSRTYSFSSLTKGLIVSPL